MLNLESNDGISQKELEKLVIIPKHYGVSINFKNKHSGHPLTCFAELFAITEEDLRETNETDP